MKKGILIVTAVIILSGCKSLNKTQIGTGTGAVVGGVIGGLLAKNSVVGALAGAAVGGTAGYFIGKHMDKQAKELKQSIPNAQIERVGEGINITFESGLFFALNSAKLSAAAKENLANAAITFVKYPDTRLLIEGHTDNTGKSDYNLELSRKRALAVQAFLTSKGVDSSRLDVKWYGDTQPKFPNDTEENRSKNRRVELGIAANDKLKQDAADGKLGN